MEKVSLNRAPLTNIFCYLQLAQSCILPPAQWHVTVTLAFLERYKAAFTTVWKNYQFSFEIATKISVVFKVSSFLDEANVKDYLLVLHETLYQPLHFCAAMSEVHPSRKRQSELHLSVIFHLELMLCFTFHSRRVFLPLQVLFQEGDYPFKN